MVSKLGEYRKFLVQTFTKEITPENLKHNRQVAKAVNQLAKKDKRTLVHVATLAQKHSSYNKYFTLPGLNAGVYLDTLSIKEQKKARKWLNTLLDLAIPERSHPKRSHPNLLKRVLNFFTK